MKPRITIAIYDCNHFFAQGIRYVLQAYFTARGWETRFVVAVPFVTADLVVSAEPWNSEYPCRANGHGRQSRSAVLVVRESGNARRAIRAPCRSELGAVTRKDTPEAVTRLVGRVLDISAQPLTPQSGICPRCSPSLTSQERAVLLGIKWELTSGRLAVLLNLHVKTISTHKRNAMRKMGFRRNSELYHWLREGGLDYGKRV